MPDELSGRVENCRQPKPGRLHCERETADDPFSGGCLSLVPGQRQTQVHRSVSIQSRDAGPIDALMEENTPPTRILPSLLHENCGTATPELVALDLRREGSIDGASDCKRTK